MCFNRRFQEALSYQNVFLHLESLWLCFVVCLWLHQLVFSNLLIIDWDLCGYGRRSGTHSTGRSSSRFWASYGWPPRSYRPELCSFTHHLFIYYFCATDGPLLVILTVVVLRFVVVARRCMLRCVDRLRWVALAPLLRRPKVYMIFERKNVWLCEPCDICA